MACQMGLRRFFADKRRYAVSDRMTLGAVLVTVFTLLVFYLVLRRPETSATFLPILLEIFSSGTERNPIGRRTESDRDGGRNPIGRRTESDRTADGIRLDGGRCPTQSARKKAPITAYFELFL